MDIVKDKVLTLLQPIEIIVGFNGQVFKKPIFCDSGAVTTMCKLFYQSLCVKHNSSLT